VLGHVGERLGDDEVGGRNVEPELGARVAAGLGRDARAAA
jgi:hypothetical protein